MKSVFVLIAVVAMTAVFDFVPKAEAQLVPPHFPFYCNPPQPCSTQEERRNEFNRQFNELCDVPSGVVPGNGSCTVSSERRGRITNSDGEWEEYNFVPRPPEEPKPPRDPIAPGTPPDASGDAYGGCFGEVDCLF